MGSRGPIAKLTRRRRNKRPPTGNGVGLGRPSRPRSLNGEALAEWNRIVPELEQMGILAKVDRGILIRYCTLWADWVEVNENIQKTGMLVKGYRGLARNPLWLVRNDLLAHLADLSRDLVVGPTARLRAGVEHYTPARSDEDRQGDVASINEYRARLTASDIPRGS